MSARKLCTLVAVFALCILFAAPAVHANGPGDDGSTITTTSTGDNPTGPTEHSPNMDPDGLTAAAPGGDASALFGWIERLFTILFPSVV